jgi:methylene-fatty-acyl-phospholipid synthase
LWSLAAAAAILSLERLCYAAIFLAPDAFRRACQRAPLRWLGPPVTVVARLCYVSKVVQLAVFVGWCHRHGETSLSPASWDPVITLVGGSLIAAGQTLNLAVFYRLGTVGVFYGSRLGYEVPWCRAFPYSLFSHPQYVGALLTIWGLFVVMRFPHMDWYALPLVETAYYIVGAWIEVRGQPLPAGPRRPVDEPRRVGTDSQRRPWRHSWLRHARTLQPSRLGQGPHRTKVQA